ncbi:MAG: O-antigen ligase domain-containing protein [Gloeocapsa sp. DLM2.Bin57]|nr:MAG: O-antigen ligase domain-containing protein [Gloeocapsa sp. DLM2.Bin57]
MTLIAKAVLLLWLPIAVNFFRCYPPRKAILITLIVGILFLPTRVLFNLPLIPNYDSETAVVYPIIIGLFIYDTKWLTRLEPWWLDVPILIFCISSIFASVRNDLGIYDGVNESLRMVWLYGVPYLVGRVYFNNLDSIRNLAVAIVKGGLVYVPFCLYEVLMSPQLHRMIYGYFPHGSGITQAIRLGGYRPMVFMNHGLAVGLFMMTATLIAVWLWQSKAVGEIWGFDLVYIVPVLVFTLILVRSTGAYLLFAYGLVILAFAKWRKSIWPFLLLIIGIITYLYIAIQGNLDKPTLVLPVLEFLSNFASPDRIGSLEFRIDEEILLIDKAREQFWFGWGGWGRSRVFEENNYGIFQDVSITDSLWIIVFGTKGVIGIVSIALSMLLPSLLFPYLRHPVRTWFYPRVGSAAVFAVLLPLFMLDNLLNYHLTVVGWVMVGSLTGLILNTQEDLSITGGKNVPKTKYVEKIPEKVGQK